MYENKILCEQVVPPTARLHPRVTFPCAVDSLYTSQVCADDKTLNTTCNSGITHQEITHSVCHLPRLVYRYERNPYCTLLKSPRQLSTAPPSCQCTQSAFRMNHTQEEQASRQGDTWSDIPGKMTK